MKKIATFLTILLSSTYLNAQTTMCFLENHTSMSTLETTALNGGECKSQKSLTQMKSEGWSVDDIKISSSSNGMNYIYILKKETNMVVPQNSQTTINYKNEDELLDKLYKKYEKKREKEKIAKKKEEEKNLVKAGEKYYNLQCAECHGKNGELEAKGYSRPLNSLSLEDMQISIRDYTNGTYDRGLAMIMQPIAYGVTSEDIKNVHAYLNSLKKK